MLLPLFFVVCVDAIFMVRGLLSESFAVSRPELL